MRKPRTLSLVIALVMLMSCCLSTVTFNVSAAANDPTIVVSDTTALPGETAQVSISLENNPGIVSMTLHMTYDTDILTLKEVKDAGVLGATAHKPELKSPYTLVWVNDLATTNFTVTGTIVTLSFEVSATARSGAVSPVEITYNYNRNEIYNKDATKVKFEIDNGSVTVDQFVCNHVDADGKWETNDTQHYHTCDCGTEFDHANHTGGEATCKARALCSTCGAAYGELNANNHKNTDLRDVDPATCNEPGYTGDTWCKDCETKIANGTVTDPTGKHVDADGMWETNDTQHFHTCSCGTEFDHANHTGGEATCKAHALCSTCGTAYGELNANNHKNTDLRDFDPGTCKEPGYSGDTWCKDCETKIANGTVTDPTGKHVDADGKWETNDTQHFHTCGCGDEFDHANHKGGTATCKNKAKCSACGIAYGELNPNNHKNTVVRNAVSATCNKSGYTGDTYCKDCGIKIKTGTTIKATGEHVDADGKWETNATQHFHTCGCGKVFDHEDHIGGAANCKDKAVCEICGASYGELNANNHTGETHLVGEKATSCKETGYTGDTYCSGCNVKLTDGKIIDKLPHDVNEWNVTKEATTEECGEKSGTCVECEEILTVTTAKLVSEIKDDNIEGSVEVEIESVGDTNISEDVFFVADEVLETITAEKKTEVENAVKQIVESDKKVKLAAVFDLKLLLRETADNGDLIRETELDLNGTVKVTIPVPTEVFEKLSDIKLVHIKDDGTTELVEFTLEDGKATFEATGFSYYTFVGTEIEPVEDSDVNDVNNNMTDKAPEPSKKINLPLLIALIFVVCAIFFVVFVVIQKKKKQSR